MRSRRADGMTTMMLMGYTRAETETRPGPMARLEEQDGAVYTGSRDSRTAREATRAQGNED